MSGGIIQSAIKNSSTFQGRFRLVSSSGSDIESEQPTLADLIVPGTGRSIYSEFDCLLELLIANGEPS